MSRWLSHTAFILALIAALGYALWRHMALTPPTFAPMEYRPLTSVAAPLHFERDFLPGLPAVPMVHSGTLVRLPEGRLLAAWFGGSREGASDVAIYGAERIAGQWSPVRVLANRRDSEQDLGRSIRKLGNPVLAGDAAGRIWLFFVVVSLGGWSTSAIAYKVSDDEGRHFAPARLLVTSPFLNISTLVRTRPLLYTDGSIALPAYHELLGKFGVLLRIASNGGLLSLTRIGSGRTVLQPSVVAEGPRHAWALLRRTGSSPARVLAARTADGGRTWLPPQPTDLPNPDASVAALRDSSGGLLLAYNPSTQGRNVLSLARSHDGRHWQRLQDLEQGADGDEFSYPFLIRGDTDDYHLIYTWQRRRMAYVHFNDGWLEQGP